MSGWMNCWNSVIKNFPFLTLFWVSTQVRYRSVQHCCNFKLFVIERTLKITSNHYYFVSTEWQPVIPWGNCLYAILCLDIIRVSLRGCLHYSLTWDMVLNQRIFGTMAVLQKSRGDKFNSDISNFTMKPYSLNSFTGKIVRIGTWVRHSPHPPSLSKPRVNLNL